MLGTADEYPVNGASFMMRPCRVPGADELVVRRAKQDAICSEARKTGSHPATGASNTIV